MTYRQALPSIFLALALGAPFSFLHAQTASDSAALATAVADVIANEPTIPVDHGPPFVLTGPPGSTWAPAVVAALKRRHPNALATGLAPLDEFHALHVSVSHIRVVGDTARADVTWSRCTSRSTGLNYWEHEMTYFFVRASGVWRFASPGEAIIADGRC